MSFEFNLPQGRMFNPKDFSISYSIDKNGKCIGVPILVGKSEGFIEDKKTGLIIERTIKDIKIPASKYTNVTK